MIKKLQYFKPEAIVRHEEICRKASVLLFSKIRLKLCNRMRAYHTSARPRALALELALALERFELNVWNVGKSIAIYDSENTRVMSVCFPLPPMVLKVPENWNEQLKNKIIDFSFYIEIIRS